MQTQVKHQSLSTIKALQPSMKEIKENIFNTQSACKGVHAKYSLKKQFSCESPESRRKTNSNSTLDSVENNGSSNVQQHHVRFLSKQNSTNSTGSSSNENVTEQQNTVKIAEFNTITLKKCQSTPLDITSLKHIPDDSSDQEEKSFIKRFNSEIQQMNEIRLQKLKTINESLVQDSLINEWTKNNLKQLRLNSQTRIRAYGNLSKDRQTQIQQIKQDFLNFKQKRQMSFTTDNEVEPVKQEQINENQGEPDSNLNKNCKEDIYQQFKQKCIEDLKLAYKHVLKDINEKSIDE